MPLAALGTRIELWAADAGSALWDGAAWDGGLWSANDWQDVTPESLAAVIAWGSDRVVGTLSVAAAGSIGITTYDPARILDPANQASPYSYALVPGTPFRLTYQGQVVRQGFLERATYAQAGDMGRLDGSDGIAMLAQSRFTVAQMTGAPTTLRALARWMIAQKSLPLTVEVDPNPADLLAGVGSFEDDNLPGWSATASAALTLPTDPTAVDGTQVLRITGVLGGGGFPQAYSPTPWPVVAGASYTVQATARTVFGANFARLRVDLYKGSTQVTSPIVTVDYPNSPAWVTKSATFAVPADGSVDGIVVRLYNWTNPAVPTEVSDFDAVTVVDTTAGAAPGPIPVSAPPTSEISGWDWLVLAATDTLTAVWVDPQGVIRFRAYGDPRDNGLAIGGAAGIPVEDVQVVASADGVWNRAQCARPAGGAVADASDAPSIARFGERLVARDRPAPDPDGWAASVILDRSAATLDWKPTTIRIQTVADLAALVAAGMVDIVQIAVDSAVPPIGVTARLLGGSLLVNWADGWSAHVTAYVPSTDWRNAQTPPPKPPDPSPPATQRVVRTYSCTADSRVSRTSGGANYGAGTAAQVPIGSWSGWQNRGLYKFATIPWGDVVNVVSARVLVTTSTQVNVGFGSSPKVIAKRITANWSEGSLSSPGSGNAVVYPGPAVTSTGQATSGVTKAQSTRAALDCSAIARAWAPPAAGGSGANQYGLALYSAGETNQAYTTEFLARETGSSGSRPVLELTLDVLA